MEANSAKVRRYFEKYKINRNSREVFDATSTEETKGMIFMKDGTIALSNMKATLLVKRGNKYYPPESEKAAKAKSTGSQEKISSITIPSRRSRCLNLWTKIPNHRNRCLDFLLTKISMKMMMVKIILWIFLINRKILAVSF